MLLGTAELGYLHQDGSTLTRLLRAIGFLGRILSFVTAFILLSPPLKRSPPKIIIPSTPLVFPSSPQLTPFESLPAQPFLPFG